MQNNRKLKKLFFYQIKNIRTLLLVIIMFVAVYSSTLIDVGHMIEPIYHSIMGGMPYKDFSVLTVLRFLLVNLVFIYYFSVSISFRGDAYRYLLFSRTKNRSTWYLSVMFYALFLSVLYWVIAWLVLMIYLFLVSLFTREFPTSYQLIFSTETIGYFLLSFSSSISLINLYLLIKYVVKKENLAFSSVAFFLLCYMFSYPLIGERHLPIVTTTMASPLRMNLEFLDTNSIGINMLGQIIQNLLVGCLIMNYLNTCGME
jgi:hypothetical protein